MTPEGKIKAKVRQLLKTYDAYWHCPVQNGMGRPSLDFICCHQGEFFAVEAKAPGKRPTPRQLLTMDEIEAAGGVVFVVDGSEALKDLESWLEAH